MQWSKVNLFSDIFAVFSLFSYKVNINLSTKYLVYYVLTFTLEILSKQYVYCTISMLFYFARPLHFCATVHINEQKPTRASAFVYKVL